MLCFDIDKRRFNYRIVGVAVDGGHVWLHWDHADAFWSLPGGRGEWHEPAEDALRRELIEEVGVEVAVGSLLWTAEDFYHYKGMHYHEIALYFRMSLPAESAWLDKNKLHEGIEDFCELTFKWWPIAQLPQIPLRPSFLAEEIKNLEITDGLNSSHPKHIRHFKHEDRPMRSGKDKPLL